MTSLSIREPICQRRNSLKAVREKTLKIEDYTMDRIYRIDRTECNDIMDDPPGPLISFLSIL